MGRLTDGTVWKEIPENFSGACICLHTVLFVIIQHPRLGTLRVPRCGRAGSPFIFLNAPRGAE